jgi:hypothetical protein
LTLRSIDLTHEADERGRKLSLGRRIFRGR